MVSSVALAYEDYGKGPAVVFIHGFPASSYSWREVVRELAASASTLWVSVIHKSPRESVTPLNDRLSWFWALCESSG